MKLEYLIEKSQVDGRAISQMYAQASWVNAIGLRCPLPLLRAKQALKQQELGSHVIVLATDPSAKGDFEAMLHHLPHSLVAYYPKASAGADSVFDVFVIRCGG